ERRQLGERAAAAVRRQGGNLWVTLDDPGTAEPARLLADVLAGTGEAGARVVADRERAIGEAVRAAGGDDVVVLAGKGRRPGQRVGETLVPWSDRAAAWRALAGRGYPGDFE
ncbi:MAG: glutamate ligase domain-containing protein, partial [Verrucomicrobiota bacterium]